MTYTNAALHELLMGDRYPYDAPDSWSEAYPNEPTPEPVDWAHRAARGIIHDLRDRRDIKQGFNDVDEDLRQEIVASLAEIIRTAHGAVEIEAIP